MAIGRYVVRVTMAAGASITTVASFPFPCLAMKVELPTLATAGNSGTVGFQMCDTAGGTFRPVYVLQGASGVTAPLQIVSCVGNAWYDMPELGSLQYVKAELVGTITTGTFTVAFFGLNPMS